MVNQCVLWPQGFVGLSQGAHMHGTLQGLCFCVTCAAPACFEQCRPCKLFAAAQVLLLFAIVLRFVEELRSAVHSSTLATPIISHSQVLSRQCTIAAKLLMGVLVSMLYCLSLSREFVVGRACQLPKFRREARDLHSACSLGARAGTRGQDFLQALLLVPSPHCACAHALLHAG